MSPIHLGSPISVEVDGEDLTPYLADLPSATMTIGGYWQNDDSITFPPGSIEDVTYRVGRASFTVRANIAPWFYRQMTGRKHPRVAALRRGYRAKRRHW